MLNVKQYHRKTVSVRAVRVTEENLEDVAKWSNGTIEKVDPDGEEKTHIHIKVSNPIRESQTRAYVGDWVLRGTRGAYKIYSNESFGRSFYLGN